MRKEETTITKINQETLDTLSELEVSALLDGLHDEELRRNPAFLEKVRKFLQQNNLKTQPVTPGVSEIEQEAIKIPTFDVIEGGKEA